MCPIVLCLSATRQTAKTRASQFKEKALFLVQDNASMPEDVEVRWVPSPEWTNIDGAPREQPMKNGDCISAPLLGSLPWPFPTLYPSTPEREAQPPLPQNALEAPHAMPPNLLDTHYPAHVPPVSSSLQPVFLLEDGDPSSLGAAALPSPAVLTPPSRAASLIAASLAPFSAHKSGAGSIGALNGPTDFVPPSEPSPQLLAAAEMHALAGNAGGESVSVWGAGGYSTAEATGDAPKTARLGRRSQEPHDSAHRHPSTAEPASEHPRERYQAGTRPRSSDRDTDGRPQSYTHQRDEYREREDADEKRGRAGEKHDERARDRDRQESGRDHSARRERQRDHAREYGGRTENADMDRRREPNQGRSRDDDRHASRTTEGARHRDDRGDYHDRHRDGRGRNSHVERSVEAGGRSREGSRPDDRIRDPPRSPWHDGLRKQKPREAEKESGHGENRRPRSRSSTRELGPPNDSCPFEAGRVIGCRCCHAAHCS